MNGKIYCYFNKRKFEEEGIKKYYIGQTVKSIRGRAGKDGSQYITNPKSKIAKAINKWGWNSFEVTVLEDNIQDIDTLNKLEMYYIEKYDSFNNGYNSTKGGEGQVGRVVSEESRRKMSLSHLGQIPVNKGGTHTLETRKKISEAKKKLVGEKHPFYGKKHKEETKRKLSENAKNNPNYGMKGKKHKKETVEKIKESNRYRWCKVYCKELDKTFESVSSASKYVADICGIKSSSSNIISVCKGKRKSCGFVIINNKKINLTWKYV